jgi:hypothetical protein
VQRQRRLGRRRLLGRRSLRLGPEHVESWPARLDGRRARRGPQQCDESRSYQVVYAFDGFAAPLAPLPTLAIVRAGDQFPVKFSLHGNFGSSAVRGVSSQPIDCATGTATDTPTEALGALTYSAGPDRYTFQWATDRTWAGSCRQLAVALNDGTVRRANLRFTR